MKLHSLVLILAMISFTRFASSQSIENSYINPGYGVTGSTVELTYSIGDLFYGEISGTDLRIGGMLYTPFDQMPTVLPDHDEQSLSFYPNPCRSVLYIRTGITDPLVFRLWNLNGVLIRDEPVNENFNIDLSDLAGGAYIIQLSDTRHNFYYIDKLIKAD